MEESKNFLYTQPELRSFCVLDYESIYSLHEHTPHSHELLYVLDGHVTLHLEEKLKFHARPGEFLLIPSGTPHRDEFPREKGLRIMFLQFIWNEIDYFQTVNNRTLASLSYEAKAESRRRLEFMRDTWNDTKEEKLHCGIQLHALLMLFYFDLLKQKSAPFPVNKRELPPEGIIGRARYFLNLNFMDDISLKETASYIGISPAYLSHFFHREYGIGFKEYLTELRLEKARELLQSTQLQIGEIAEKSGFSSSSYFIKVFRDHFGVTPGLYAGKKEQERALPEGGKGGK